MKPIAQPTNITRGHKGIAHGIATNNTPSHIAKGHAHMGRKHMGGQGGHLEGSQSGDGGFKGKL